MNCLLAGPWTHFSFEIFKIEAPEYAMLKKTPALNRRIKSLAFTHIDFSPERLQDIDRREEKKRPKTSYMYQNRFFFQEVKEIFWIAADF